MVTERMRNVEFINFLRRISTRQKAVAGFSSPAPQRAGQRYSRANIGLYILSALIIAPLLGAVIALGSPILTGALAGILFVIPFIVYVESKSLLPLLFVYIFLIQGVISNSFHLKFALWFGSGFAMLFLLRTLLELTINKMKPNWQHQSWQGTGKIAGAILVYLLFFFFSLSQGSASKGQIFSQLRFSLPMFGVFLALASIQFTTRRTRLLWTIILFVVVVQLPLVLYQHFTLKGLGDWDNVVGTFGRGMSPVLVIFSVAAFMYCLACWSRGLMPLWLLLAIGSIAMANILLGEVKAVVFWLPVGVIYILRERIFRNISSLIAYGCLIAGFLVLVFYAYEVMYWNADGTSHRTSEQEVAQEGGYFFNPNQINKHTGEIGRVAAVFLWYRDPGQGLRERLIGFGPGASATSTSTGRGVAAARYRPLQINVNTLATLLWDVGILGALSYIFIFIFGIYEGFRFVARGTASAIHLAIVDACTTMLIILSSTLIYNDTLMVETASQLLLCFCLGCVIQYSRFGKDEGQLLKRDARTGGAGLAIPA